MFCKNCGSDVGGAKFCHNCGANVGEMANQKRFCSNCGTDVSGSRFCPACGTAINTTTPPYHSTYSTVLIKKSVPLTRSWSFILFAILGGLLIAMLFFDFFGECYSWSIFQEVTYDEYYSSINFWHLVNSESAFIWGAIAIILFATPMIFSFINFFSRNKALAIINTAVTSVSFVYILILSLLLSDHYYSFEGYLSSVEAHTFSSFGIGFYLILAISLGMCCISIFDTINNPLIKSKQPQSIT